MRLALRLLAAILFPSMTLAAAPAVELATDGAAKLPIVISPRAAAQARATAEELADYLGRISGAKFAVEAGDGARGIVLGLSGDFTALPFAVDFSSTPLQREEYLLRSHAQGFYILGASDLALSHAAWDLLHRLGYRQYFPGEKWEIIPRALRLSIAVDERQSPSFNARRIWYNWGLWGYNDKPYHQWCVRNRMARGLELNSGHAYDEIYLANKAEFEKHPEYLALVGGERKPRGDIKFCIANAGLRQLVVAHALRQFERRPDAHSISMEPSDGGGWCECEPCAAMGSPSDRVVTLANEVAAAINANAPRPRYVGIYAYHQHSAPPRVRVHPNVIPSATTAFIGGGLTFEQVVRGWQAQGATMGAYDYLSVVDWDWNLPRNSNGSRPAQLAKFLPRLHEMGVRFYDAESGDCWGPCGLGYYAAGRILWDVREASRLDAIVEDFLGNCFGPAREPMREFYRLINFDTQRRPPSDLLARMYRQLDAARKLTDDPAIRARLEDLVLYTRHVELYNAYAAGRLKVDEVVRHDWRMRTTMMVHSYGLWCRLLNQQAALDPKHPLKSPEPITQEEIAAILAAGISTYQPVELPFTPVTYSDKLVPAAAPLKFPPVPPGQYPTHPQDHQRYLLWIPDGAKSLEIELTIQKVWANRTPLVQLWAMADVKGDPIASDDSPRPDGRPRTVRLPTSYAGLHRLETIDGGDYTRIAWPAGVAVSIESGIETPHVTSHFRGAWTMYFYVPRGSKAVGGWASRIANWAPRISGRLLDADGREVLDFAKLDEGWFHAPVPPGQDGRLWKFVDSQGQRLLMTVPPYLATTPQNLLLPAEVIEADAKP